MNKNIMNMKNLLLIVITILPYWLYGQGTDIKNTVNRNIIGKWELDYKSTKDFYGNIMTENDEKENTLEFFENGKYKRFIGGFESGGTFQITEKEFRLDEKYRIGDKEGSERGKYILKIEKFKKNKLIISFTECDVKVYQVYQKTKKTVFDYEGYNDVKEIIEAFKSDDTKIIKSISTDKGYVNLLKLVPTNQQKDTFFKQIANDLSIATFSIGISMEMIDHYFFETENKRIELLIIPLKDGHKLFDLKIEKSSNNIIKTGTEFKKADDLLVKYGAKKNVFSRKFTKPSVSYMLPNNVGIIIIYDKKEGKNIIVELLKCNNSEAEKDIREWKNVEQIELIEK